MKDNWPTISVIIPTHNRSDLLPLTLESVLVQTYPNLEIIVVDDGSTDNTAEIIAPYTGRVMYLRQANKGPGAARNTGIQHASGDYLTFLDDDDLIMPEKLARQAQLLAAKPEAGVVYCGFYTMDESGNYLDKAWSLPEGAILKELICGDFIWTGAPLIRRHCLEQVGQFDESLLTSQDWDMWLRLAQAGFYFACIREPLGAYRIHPGSRVMTKFSLVEHTTLAVMDKAFADPRLPAEVVAIKNQAYGGVRFWISCQYYEEGIWAEAQRHLAATLALRPYLLEQPQELLQALIYHAVSARVGDPVKFMTDVFDHLPDEASFLQRYRQPLLGQAYIGSALRSYSLGNLIDARRSLARAMVVDPRIVERLEDFAGLFSYCAMHFPIGEPCQFVDTVFQNLPVEASPLKRVWPRVSSEVNIGCAFQDFFAGRKTRARREILRALRYRPAWLRNRGVVSILLKSLLSLPGRGSL